MKTSVWVQQLIRLSYARSCLLTDSVHKDRLQHWAESNRKTSIDLYVEDTTSLELKDFENFISVRRTELTKKLKAVLVPVS